MSGLPENRRAFLRAMGTLSAAAAGLWVGRAFDGPRLAAALQADDPALAGAPLVRYPEKTVLFLLTPPPPQLETPLKYFDSAITPNEAFYVRYHIPPPATVDVSAWRLKVGGHVNKPLELSLDDLQNRF